MKRFLSILSALILILGLAVPSMSLAAPKTPAIKKATADTSSVTISWNGVSGAKGYQIAWGPKGSGCS